MRKLQIPPGLRLPALLTLLALLAMMALAPATGMAAQVNVDSGGLALQGYDPVAYFSENRAVPGDAAYTASHDGATYRFSSAGNRDAFVRDPAHYVPAYGGYCAYGMAQGYKAPVEPDQFSIVGDRLYLNYNAQVQKLWRADIPGYLEKADASWKGIGSE